MPLPKSAKEVSKTQTSDSSEKPESPEKQNQVEEKDKPADLLLIGLSDFKFDGIYHAKNSEFFGNFSLLHRHLQIPEQPPK